MYFSKAVRVFLKSGRGHRQNNRIKSKKTDDYKPEQGIF